jgi:hypothetical protein
MKHHYSSIQRPLLYVGSTGAIPLLPGRRLRFLFLAKLRELVYNLEAIESLLKTF